MSGEVYAAAKASTCCDAVGEEYPKGRRGSNTPLSGDVHPVLIFNHPAPYAQVLHEFAYNSETNGDGANMFILGRTRPS